MKSIKEIREVEAFIDFVVSSLDVMYEEAISNENIYADTNAIIKIKFNKEIQNKLPNRILHLTKDLLENLKLIDGSLEDGDGDSIADGQAAVEQCRMLFKFYLDEIRWTSNEVEYKRVKARKKR